MILASLLDLHISFSKSSVLDAVPPMQFTYCLEYAPILAGKVPNCFCVELHLESRNSQSVNQMLARKLQ